MKTKNIRVIFDTNVWISFLIGKRLQTIAGHIANGDITIVTSDELIAEIRDVSLRPKLKKYFPQKKVKELIDFLEVIAFKTESHSTFTLCKDPKDDFLLGLIEDSKANVLVTGDKYLLELNPFGTAIIITPKEFEQLLTGQ